MSQGDYSQRMSGNKDLIQAGTAGIVARGEKPVDVCRLKCDLTQSRTTNRRSRAFSDSSKGPVSKPDADVSETCIFQYSIRCEEICL